MVILNPSRHGERIVNLMLDTLEEKNDPVFESLAVANSGRTPDLEELEAWFQAASEPPPTVVVAVTDSSVEIAERYREPDSTALVYWAQDRPEALPLQLEAGAVANATGVSASLSPSAAEDVRLIYLLRFVGAGARVLMIYDPRDVDAPAGVERLEEVASAEGATLLRAPVESADAALSQIARFDEIDAVFLAPDRVIGQVAEELYDAAVDQGVPLAGPNVSSVRDGALLSYAFSEESVARLMSEMVLSALENGAELDEIEPTAPGYDLAFNLETASRIGLDVGDAFLEEVTILFRGQ